MRVEGWLPFSVTEADGEKEQLTKGGNVPQPTVTVWVEPLSGVIVSVVVADWPAAIVNEARFAPMLKSAGAAVTDTTRATELLPLKVVLPT